MSSGHHGTTTLMNSQQLWLPAQAQASRHSWIDSQSPILLGERESVYVGSGGSTIPQWVAHEWESMGYFLKPEKETRWEGTSVRGVRERSGHEYDQNILYVNLSKINKK